MSRTNQTEIHASLVWISWKHALVTECNDNQSFRALASYFYLNTTNSVQYKVQLTACMCYRFMLVKALKMEALLQLKELSVAQKQHGTPDFGQSATSSRAHHSSESFNIRDWPKWATFVALQSQHPDRIFKLRFSWVLTYCTESLDSLSEPIHVCRHCRGFALAMPRVWWDDPIKGGIILT